MSSPPVFEIFLRFLKEKQSLLVRASGVMISALASEDRDSKIAAAKSMLSLSQDLRSGLAESDVPQWLDYLPQYLSNYINGGWNSAIFLSHYINLKADLEKHNWDFSVRSDDGFDFDSIFEHYKNESRLPDLFDEIVRILEEIQQSGAIDSINLLRGLERVIATVKKSKDGSYFSLNSAWEFLMSFFKNYLWGELAKLPILGGVFQALEKTIAEANEEMFRVHAAVDQEMRRVVEAEVTALKGKSTFAFLSYDRTGKSVITAEIPRLGITA